MSLLEEALLLQRAAHDLMYLGMDGSPILLAMGRCLMRLWRMRLAESLLPGVLHH